MNLPSVPNFDRQAFEHRLISKHPRAVNDDVLHFNTQSGSQWYDAYLPHFIFLPFDGVYQGWVTALWLSKGAGLL